MVPNFPGGYPPGGQRTHHGGGGKRRKPKRKTFLQQLGEALRDLIVGILIVFAIVIAIEAVPYLLKFEPGDTIDYSNNNIFGKIEVFKDAMRHKRGISEMTFSHDGKSVTFTDEKGTLTGIDAEGYGYGDADELEDDIDEARRIIHEWGLDK